jgi:hypothetical protein
MPEFNKDEFLNQINNLPDRLYISSLGFFAEKYDLDVPTAKKVLIQLGADFQKGGKTINANTPFMINLDELNNKSARLSRIDSPFVNGSAGRKVLSHSDPNNTEREI